MCVTLRPPEDRLRRAPVRREGSQAWPRLATSGERRPQSLPEEQERRGARESGELAKGRGRPEAAPGAGVRHQEARPGEGAAEGA